jgi:hypothetical protein
MRWDCLLLTLAATAAAERIVLPPGLTEVADERPIESGTTVVGDPRGSVLRLAAGFRGRAAFVVECGAHVRFEGFTIDGNRAANAQTQALPTAIQTFARSYQAGGILAEDARDVTVEGVHFREMGGFAVLASRVHGFTVRRVEVMDSGSRLPGGINNATGGILIEDWSREFAVRESRFVRILGNAVWTHSRAISLRNEDGEIADNTFESIGRDAIQVGHATRVAVRGNRGTHIGYPLDAVDARGGIPVAIDTAGDVANSTYTGNHFEELNGKCIDLDGFHHGTVSGNICRNRGPAAGYPSGHYGIVFNNSNPQMRSEAVLVENNRIEGMKYGGIFLLGRGHIVRGNRLLDVNRAGCPESHAEFGCLYFPDQPDILASGIYLGVSAEAGSRAETSGGIRVEDNVITGHGMGRRCIGHAPQVKLKENTVKNNECRNLNQ